MNKKIVLGLGLCLLLTVINLHRAMDNYGITDAKFKVGVLADESSSSGTSAGYTNVNGICSYTFTGLLPNEKIMLFGQHIDYANEQGDLTINVQDGEIYCLDEGTETCFDTNCQTLQNGDIYSFTQDDYYDVFP